MIMRGHKKWMQVDESGCRWLNVDENISGAGTIDLYDSLLLKGTKDVQRNKTVQTHSLPHPRGFLGFKNHILKVVISTPWVPGHPVQSRNNSPRLKMLCFSDIYSAGPII